MEVDPPKEVVEVLDESDDEVMVVSTAEPPVKGQVTLESLLREPHAYEIQEVKSASRQVQSIIEHNARRVTGLCCAVIPNFGQLDVVSL